MPVAISPAFPDQTCTVHDPFAKVASVCGLGGYRSSQSCTFGSARKRSITSPRVRWEPVEPSVGDGGSGLVVEVVVSPSAAGTSASAATATAASLSA
jgi:hypothetical protein